MKVYIAVSSVLLIIVSSIWLAIIRTMQTLNKIKQNEKLKLRSRKLERNEKIAMGIILIAGLVCIICIFI